MTILRKNKKHPCDKGAKTHGTTLVFHSLALTRRVRRGSSPAARERNSPSGIVGCVTASHTRLLERPVSVTFLRHGFSYSCFDFTVYYYIQASPVCQAVFHAAGRRYFSRGGAVVGPAKAGAGRAKTGINRRRARNRRKTARSRKIRFRAAVLWGKCPCTRRGCDGSVRRGAPRQRMEICRRKARDFKIFSTNLSTASGARGSSPVGRKVRPNAIDFLPAPICSER